MTKRQRTLILDNGAYSLKARYNTDMEPRVMPNTIFKCQNDRRRVFVSDELSDCQYRTKLFYSLPFERGYLVNWNTELEIWDYLFGPDVLDTAFSETRLLLTDPNCLVPAMKNIADEVIFEVYQFSALNMTSAPALIASAERQGDCVVVVDSGYSFTHVIPFYKGALIEKAIRRIDVGGKALTNQLKEWISYRQIDVRDETYIINQAKEDACFVTTDINRDIKLASLQGKSNPILRDYILPDFVNSTRGQLVEHARQTSEVQKIELSLERFVLPELLFHPNNIGIKQSGISETVMQVLSEVKTLLPDIKYTSNVSIVCAGGNVMFTNFIDRMHQELEPNFFGDECFNVRKSSNPITHAWSSAQHLIQSNDLEMEKGFVTREEFNEFGSNVFLNKQRRI